jgi:hypothetical protein
LKHSRSFAFIRGWFVCPGKWSFSKCPYYKQVDSFVSISVH